MIEICAALFGLFDICTEETAVRTRGYPWEERILVLSRRRQGLIVIVYDWVVKVDIYIDRGSSEIKY